MENTDDLYPGNKSEQEQNYEIHSPSGPVNFSFPYLKITYQHGSQYRNQRTNVNKVRMDS